MPPNMTAGSPDGTVLPPRGTITGWSGGSDTGPPGPGGLQGTKLPGYGPGSRPGTGSLDGPPGSNTGAPLANGTNPAQGTARSGVGRGEGMPGPGFSGAGNLSPGQHPASGPPPSYVFGMLPFNQAGSTAKAAPAGISGGAGGFAPPSAGILASLPQPFSAGQQRMGVYGPPTAGIQANLVPRVGTSDPATGQPGQGQGEFGLPGLGNPNATGYAGTGPSGPGNTGFPWTGSLPPNGYGPGQGVAGSTNGNRGNGTPPQIGPDGKPLPPGRPGQYPAVAQGDPTRRDSWVAGPGNAQGSMVSYGPRTSSGNPANPANGSPPDGANPNGNGGEPGNGNQPNNGGFNPLARPSGGNASGEPGRMNLSGEFGSVVSQDSGPALKSGRPRGPSPIPSRLQADHDFIIQVTCAVDGVVFRNQLYPAYPAANQQAVAATLVRNIQQTIDRKQATVRDGEPMYRPLIRLKVEVDGLRSYLWIYRALESLRVPMSREDVLN